MSVSSRKLDVQTDPASTPLPREIATRRPEVVFAALLALLTLSFFLFPDQAGRNIVLYLTALSAHVFLWDAKHVFGRPEGAVVLLLVVMPLVSLLWSTGTATEIAKKLVLASYCILFVYLGVCRLLRLWPALADHLAVVLLLAGNVLGLAAVANWIAFGGAPGTARMEGLLGLDNPVHSSILLLASTLVVLWQILDGRRPPAWLAGMIVPLVFVLLAGGRMAAGSYVVVVLTLASSRCRWAALVVGAAVASLCAAVVALVGVDRMAEIWISRGLSYREVIWEQVWSAYRECNPFIGCGIGTRLSVSFAGIESHRAHSIGLATLYHQGLLGLAIFAGTVGWLVHKGLRNGGAAQGWAWALAFVLIANVTSGHHVLVRASLFWPSFWIPVMILAAIGTESSRAART